MLVPLPDPVNQRPGRSPDVRSTSMTPSVQVTVDEGVAVVRVDDGKRTRCSTT
jgi:hypothetical protein